MSQSQRFIAQNLLLVEVGKIAQEEQLSDQTLFQNITAFLDGRLSALQVLDGAKHITSFLDASKVSGASPAAFDAVADHERETGYSIEESAQWVLLANARDAFTQIGMNYVELNAYLRQYLSVDEAVAILKSQQGA